MRRWNGWGEEKTNYPLPESAARYLAGLVGEGTAAPDAPLAEALRCVAASRLSPHPLVSTDPLDRLLHARGQSLPDWVALRSGEIGAVPDGIAYPESDQDVRDLLDFCQAGGIRCIPYGGGTSVVGHINPLPADHPVLTMDLSRFNRLESLDETSRLATIGAGASGPQVEGLLNKLGYTLGHYPQSFELSTLGGWIATRSSGQQSYHYGRIEDLFAGGHVETLRGPLDLPPLPASAAGPDLRQLVLGSEGRLGVITRATVRIRPLPVVDAFYGIFFRDFASGAAAVREMAQERLSISMLRMSDAQETDTTLMLSGKDSLVSWARRGLNLFGYGEARALLVLGVTGDPRSASLARRQAFAIARDHGGLPTGQAIGRQWRKSRFLAPYLRNTLWEAGYALDTLETAVPWSKVLDLALTVKQSIQQSLQAVGERPLVFAHLSHVYRDGASLYVTCLFRRAQTPQGTLERWRLIKEPASQAIQAAGGTISHQHGVGIDHAPYLPLEKGEVGMAALRSVCEALDPDGLLNPGKLL